MNISETLAHHFEQIYFGGNWSGNNYYTTLQSIPFEKINIKIGDHHSIMRLFHHATYYVSVQIRFLETGILDGNDLQSFETPLLSNISEWEAYKTNRWEEAKKIIAHIKNIPNDQWEKEFALEKYGNFYRNTAGNIEHLHYHLGQISLLSKLI